MNPFPPALPKISIFSILLGSAFSESLRAVSIFTISAVGAESAVYALSEPAPTRLLIKSGSAVLIKVSRTSTLVSSGFADRTKAATPDTCAAAMDVPDEF